MNKSKIFQVLAIVPFFIMILTISFTGCTDKNLAFYNKILNDFDTNSYFIAVDVNTPLYKGRALIENNTLYSFLNKTQGYNKSKYQSVMRRILAHNRTLKINIKANEMLDFAKVPEIEDVIRNANSGVDNFIAHYFDGVMLNYGISAKEESAIINQLFYWNIPSKIDKITHELIIG